MHTWNIYETMKRLIHNSQRLQPAVPVPLLGCWPLCIDDLFHPYPPRRCLWRALVSGLACAWGLVSGVTAFAAELKVDLNPPERRTDFLTPHWENWDWSDGLSGSRTFGDITVTFKADSTNILRCVWYKGLLDFDAHMGAEGIAMINPGAEAGIDMVIRGLKPGKHTLVTYHNEVRDLPPARFDVGVGDLRKTTGLVATVRGTNDYELASTFLEIDVVESKDVVVRYRPDDASANRSIIISGFEIDTADPHKKAAKPSPNDDDEHVAENSTLTWTAPAGARMHQIYFGMDSNAVARAGASSPEFKGNFTSPRFPLSALNHMETYFWRVDEMDESQKVTRGDVWRLRPRFLAFPTAEGYGRFARGGRGGRVIEVSNLNDSGPGSLRAAVEAEGPRTVVFNVSGLITLESRLILRNPYITVAGQTAPGKGICTRKYNFGLGWAHDAIVRYVRVRPGNLSGQTLDGMGMAGCDHCIVDHCSISWTLDEAFSSRGAKNITLQRALISEALNEAGHKKYPPGTQHGYAASIGGDIGSFHHNLLAHCAGRNWSLAGGLDTKGFFTGRLDLRNNVVYNWKNRATDGGAHEVNFVANYYQPGPATKTYYALNAQYGNFPGTQQYYFEGNIMPGHFGLTNPTAGRTATTERGGKLPADYSPWVDKPFFDSHVKIHSAQES
jgi:hypothetical protein